MPRIIVDPDMIDEIEEIARRAFAPWGVLPLKSGSTEIIPSDGNTKWIYVFLHKKPERNKKVLNQLWGIFAHNSKKYGVSIIDQPENLWRKV